MRNHYETLKVARDAPPEVIRMAYKVLCQKYHPDKFPGNRDAAERITKELNAAYAVLSDPGKRTEYDDFLNEVEAMERDEKPRESESQRHKPKEEPQQKSQSSAGNAEANQQYNPNGSKPQPPKGPPPPPPENHHPWRRMAARYIDMHIFGFLGVLGGAYFFLYPENPVYGQLVALAEGLVGCILLEPIVLIMFGGTPGKAILNVSLKSDDELGFFKRTFQVYFYGLNFGFRLLLAPFFFLFDDYKQLKNTGMTRWDIECGTQVYFGNLGVFSFLVGATLVLSLVVLNMVSTVLNRMERKEWFAATYSNEGIDSNKAEKKPIIDPFLYKSQ